ncbi:MAG: hypothetical protein KME40_33395 [Komarekiella atlantica HA4396-MV6]|nr:hypothetical protein [Komarekiella atlantica HA4396-MV6]
MANRPYRVYVFMVARNLTDVFLKTKYFARFVVVVFLVFAALKYSQTTLLNSRTIHLNTDLSTGSVSAFLL